MTFKLKYDKQDLIKFQIGRYVEVYSIPDQDGHSQLENIGTIIEISKNCVDELVFIVKVLYPVYKEYCLVRHPCYLKLIGE